MTGVFEVEVRSITTMHIQKLVIDKADAELMRGKRILIIDDVISTGESLHAMEELVTRAGGIIAGKMAVLAEARPPSATISSPSPRCPCSTPTAR